MEALVLKVKLQRQHRSVLRISSYCILCKQRHFPRKSQHMMKFYFACFHFLALLYTVKGKNITVGPNISSVLPSSSDVPISSLVSPSVSSFSSVVTISRLVSPSVSSFSSVVTISRLVSPSVSSFSSVVTISRLVSPSVSSFSSASGSLVINASSTSLPIPGNTSAINPNSTIYPNTTSAFHQNSSIPVPSIVTHSSLHSMIPVTPTKSAGKDDKDYDKMKKRMWIAAAFAIIFAITTVILGYFVYRQRRINRELQGDPAASRLL